MKQSADLWSRFSAAVLWGAIAALLLLFPLMIYLLQPMADIQQTEIRKQVQQQKELLSRLRTEAALITTGYRDEPREAVLSYLSEIYRGAHRIEQRLVRIPQDIGPARRSWQRYGDSLQPLQESLLEISSASALYGYTLSQLETVFQDAESVLSNAGLSAAVADDYDLLLAQVMVQALRHGALPSDSSDMALEQQLEKLRTLGSRTPSVQVQNAFTKFIAYVDGLREATNRIRTAAGTLMGLSTYEHLNSFDSLFESWITQEQIQQRKSRWILLISVLLLVTVVVAALVRLKKTQQKLLSSNSELQAYKTAMDEHAIVSVTDPRGCIEYVNEKFSDISGYQPEELIGQTHRMLNSGVHPKGFFKQLWQQVLAGKVWHDEVCNRRKDGSLYWVSATVVPMCDVHNRLESIISVRTDITAIKQAERALTLEKERAEVANKAKSDFLANMSHEIRTPMNAVIGMSHLARQVSTDQQVSGYIDKIQHSAQNLLAIINDILDFSKIEAGRLEVEQIPFRLDNVISHLNDLARLRADEKHLPLSFDVDPEAPNYLLGDPLRLGQVLLNLVNNAIKFTAEGSVSVNVRLLAHSDEGVELRFSVTDTGIGLSKEQMGRLFQSFSQADSSTTRNYGGTGLGLAISKQLVELMHGEIGVHSTPGAGSEFFFTLTFEEHTPEDSRKQVDIRSIRVLAIDDDDSSLESVHSQLTALGIAVETENSAPGGLNRLVNASVMDEAPFNVLLIDWQMPRMDGLDVARAVRHNSSLPWQPVIIMLTGHGGDDLQRRINSNLIDSVLLKPVTGSHLLDTILNTLAEKSREHQGPSIRTLFREGDEINALLGARVLIAEDNQINQEVISGLLEPYGLDITLVSNGREAVDALQEDSYDLVLMDLQMPELDGLQATAQILQMHLPKRPPIIAMTAHAQPEEVRHCLDSGMSDHIAKPINPETLREILIRWIEPRVISGYSFAPDESPAQVVLPEQVYGMDLQQALHSTGNNAALLLKLMRQFCHDYTGGVAVLKQYWSEGRWQEAARWLHTLKGVSATLGMHTLSARVAELEQLTFSQTLAQESDIAPLSEELDRICADMSPLMATSGPSSDFARQIQPQRDQAAADERLQQLLPELITLLKQGDPDVLEQLPELLELLQHDASQLDQAARALELAEEYEFDAALQLLDALQLTSKI